MPGDIGNQPVAQGDQVLENGQVLFPKAPDLVVPAGRLLDVPASVVAVPAAVEAHHRAEYAVLEPANDQLPERFAVNVPAVKTADVGVPPGQAAHGHVQAGFDLLGQAFKGGLDVPRPDQGPKPLGAGVGRPGKGDDVVPAHRLHPLVDQLGVAVGVDQRRFVPPAGVEDQVVKVLGMDLRLRLVEPEQVDPVVQVVFLELLKDVGPAFRVGGVDFRLRAVKLKHPAHAGGGADQHVLVRHVGVVFAVLVDGRPHGHHQPHAHFVKLVRHGFWIGPVGGVEFIVPLLGPVEVIDDDHRQRDAQLPVFPGHLQHLLLPLVAQLALPEAQGVFRDHRGVARQVRQLFAGLPGAAGNDHVVHRFGAVAAPAGPVEAQLHRAGGGHVPKKPVAQGGIDVRDRRLGVDVAQVHRAALLAEDVDPLVAQAVELLVFVRLEGGPHRPQAAAHAAVVAVAGGEGHFRLLPEDRLILDKIGDPSPLFKPDLQPARLEPHVLPVPPDVGLRLPGEQGPVLQFDPGRGRSLKTDAAFGRYADHAGFPRPCKPDPVVLDGEFHCKKPSVFH